MKPFDLTKFLAGEPAINGHGMKVIDHHVFKNGQFFIMFENGCYYYDNNGNPVNWIGEGYELYMEEKEVELWVNVYEGENSCYDGWFHGTESEAKSNVLESSNFKGTYKITI